MRESATVRQEDRDELERLERIIKQRKIERGRGRGLGQGLGEGQGERGGTAAPVAGQSDLLARRWLELAERRERQQGVAVGLLQSSRGIECYERLNHIEEGSYGVVFRARERTTGRICAVKRIKFDRGQMGFPMTSLREIHTLMACRSHPHIVALHEVVVGSDLDQVYLVMEFIEHDIKTLMQAMSPQTFLISESKTLMLQLLSAVRFMHARWIIHRDLKTSNLLLNNRGQLKIADFGLARRLGDPPGHVTPLVVTLWYRAPEILLGAERYTSAIDMWSVGCILGELVLGEPLLPGRTEVHQLHNIFSLLGHPTAQSWPDFAQLPRAKMVNFAAQPRPTLPDRFARCGTTFSDSGIDLLRHLLHYNPATRLSSAEAETHPWFKERPPPKHPDFFHTFPSPAAGHKLAKKESPAAPAPAHAGEDLYGLG